MLSKGSESMAVDGHLNFDTKIDEKGFSSGIGRLGSIAKGGLGVLSKTIAGVGTAMGGVAVAGLKFNATMEQYITSFEVMTGSAEEAADIMERLKKIGAETPFDTETIADTTQLLMNYGMTADEAISKMQMLGDISQGSADKMNRIAMAYGQMSSAGKVQLEDVKQMIEAGFNPLQEISESTGESMASLYDRISKGTLSVDEITASMQRATAEGGKYFQSMEKQSKTVSGLISTMKDNAQQLLGSVMEPISESLRTSLLPAAIEAIEGMQTAFEEDGVEGLIAAGGNVIGSLLTGMAEGAPMVVETAMGILNSILLSLQENAPRIAQAGVSMLSSFIQGLLTMLPTLATTGVSLITNLATGIAQALPQLIPKAVQAVMNFASTILSNLPTIISAGIKILTSVLEGIISSLPQLIAYAPKLIASLLKAIIGAVGQLLSAGPKIILSIGKGILNAVGGLWSYAKKIPAKIKEAVTSVDWGELGMNIIKGIGNGLLNMGGWLVDKAKGIVKGAWNGIKNFLGINSPSRLMRDTVGKYMAMGIGVGFDDEMPKVTDDMISAVDMGTKRIKANTGVMAPDFKSVGDNIYNNTTTVNQTVNINQPVRTPAETARALRKEANFGLAG